MATVKQYAGECPDCGDEMYVHKTKSYKRFVKCINPECGETGYGIPKRGSIESTGLVCPRSNVPLLAVVKYTKIPGRRFVKNPDKVYFYSDRPCFACPDVDSCEVRKEAELDY